MPLPRAHENALSLVLPCDGHYRALGGAACRVSARAHAGLGSVVLQITTAAADHGGQTPRRRRVECYRFGQGVVDCPTTGDPVEAMVYWTRSRARGPWRLPARSLPHGTNAGLPRSGAEAVELVNDIRRGAGLAELVEDRKRQL